MTNIRKPRILYVLGLAYSGSTIFGLTIGRHSKVLNLGEIVNLENDYGPDVQCTCGEKLSRCSFWAKIKVALSEQKSNVKSHLQWQLSKEGKRSFLEEKSDISRIKIILGGSAESVYGQLNTNNYLKKNEEFFSVIQNTLKDIELIVDLSKTHERLEILNNSKKLDIWVLYLTRDADSIFYSNIKRPKKSRAKWGPKILREALLQCLRTSGCEKIYTRFNPNKRFMFTYEEFIANPGKAVDIILNKMKIQSEPIDYGAPYNLRESGQHLYVGNRWLFSEKSKYISIDQSKVPQEFSIVTRIVSKMFLGTSKKNIRSSL